MTRQGRILFNFSLTVVIALFITLSLVALRNTERRGEFRSLTIEIQDSTHRGFLRPEALSTQIFDSIAPLGSPLDSVDVTAIESMVGANPYVERCEVRGSVLGDILVRIWEREPVVRVVSDMGYDFYVDSTFCVLWPVVWYRPEVFVLGGSVDFSFPQDFSTNFFLKNSPSDHKKIEIIINFAKSLTSAPYLHSLTSQVYLEGGGVEGQDGADQQRDKVEKTEINTKIEAKFVMAIDCGTVIFGDIENPDKKIQKLTKYFRTAYKYSKINKNTQIDARFKGQIVTRPQTSK